MSKQHHYFSERLFNIKRQMDNGKAWRDVLVDSLTKQQHAALLATSRYGKMTSLELAKHLNVNQNVASMLLQSLWKVQLLTREKVVNENGREFVYRVKA